MNKIKDLLKGSSIAMVVAGLLVAGVASAGLVNYLGNDVATTATVTSPVKMSVNNGRDASLSGDASLSIGTTGGSDFTFTTVAENNANNEISGYPVIVVEASGEKLTGEEFTRVLFDDGTNNGGVDEENISNGWDITDDLYVVHSDGTLEQLSSKTWDNEKLVLFVDNDGSGSSDGTSQVHLLTAGEVNWNVMKIRLAQNVVGTYQISAQYVNNLTDYAAEQYSE